MKKSSKIIGSFIILLIAIRLILPHFLLKEVNKVLANLDGYHGHMEDLDLHLYRGAYKFEGVKIESVEGEMRSPFFQVDQVDISIDWRALFKGHIVGDVTVLRPILNFAIDSTAEVTQTGSENNWLKTIEELVPIDANLNLLEINNGIVKYSDYSMNPAVEVKISNLDLNAKNLSNVENEDQKLPSRLTVTGTSDGNGQLTIDSKLNILKDIPDFELDFKLEGVELKELNNFTEAYASFDFEEGRMSLYHEMTMENGSYSGYAKPILEDIKILDLKKEKDDKFMRKLWEGLISISKEVIENQRKERVASKVPFSGTVDGVDTKSWKAIMSVLKNAFIKALPKRLDQKIGSSTEKTP